MKRIVPILVGSAIVLACAAAAFAQSADPTSSDKNAPAAGQSATPAPDQNAAPAAQSTPAVTGEA